MTPETDPIDWSLCTPEAQELEQLRHWSALPLRVRLETLEAMCDHARATVASLKARGLPYIDPYTGESVPGINRAPDKASQVDASL